MPKQRIIRGTKFYKYDGDEPFIIRLYDYDDNKDIYKFKAPDGSYINLTFDMVYQYYTELRFDGIVTFSVVTLDDHTKDVMVCIHSSKTQYEEVKTTIPFAVCRQSIYDWFTNQIKKSEQVTYVGTSISQLSCPSNVEFTTTIGCTSIVSSIALAIYIDDSLDEILSMVNKRKYDSILRTLKEAANKNYPQYRGYCTSIERLLKQNRFMYDFHMCFGIHELPFEFIEGKTALNLKEHEILEKEVGAGITATYILPFTKEIDLSELQRDYILVVSVMDEEKITYGGKKDIYIVGYDKVTD